MRTLTPTRTLSIDTGQEQAMITVYATLMQNWGTDCRRRQATVGH